MVTKIDREREWKREGEEVGEEGREMESFLSYSNEIVKR